MPAAAAAVIVFAAAAVAVYLQLRHHVLTALVAAAPALAIAGFDFAYALEPDVLQFLVYGFAVVCGQLLARLLVRGICDGLPPGEALWKGWRGVDRVAGPVAAATMLPALANMAYPQLFNLPIYYLVNVLCATAAVVAAVAAASWRSYTEEFIARANLAREAWERRMAPLGFIAQARWAFSLSGAALVLATLAGFGMRGLHLGEAWPYFPIAGVFWVAALALVTRDWRMTAALTGAFALVVALALAARAGAHGAFDRVDIAWLSLACATGAVPMAVLAGSWSAFQRESDDIAGSLARAVRSEGPAVLFATIYPAVPALLFCAAFLARRGDALPAVLVVAACFPFAIFVVFPALTVVLHTLIPHYRGVEEVFGKR